MRKMKNRLVAKMLRYHHYRTLSPEIRWRLSTNVKSRRRARGHTQKELAKICGLSKTYISDVEQGAVNISLTNLERLALGLCCSEEDLLRHPSECYNCAVNSRHNRRSGK